MMMMMMIVIIITDIVRVTNFYIVYCIV